nr:UDP-N-acetyl-D-glucosamine dehydrogenase [Gemmatimonadota bacterium]NIQ52052.1 UDP-N-acetyl-D-glucosamine dehydrogenase [Gemmatimonadota bacterium]NIU72149.1 UDP-N-acetyl-D-glucosamine dehydrogenase [Gammaproteobacteria bacterium]NIX42701.1 UDP-N-acetyl-D-glucosamine dehydrogenase [Gemmatimonadota bacterium]NIY06866.1 UDP-N-acetyl-D-glucosamine dehydrogenase [Gemmatimonadota bacterium]
MNGDLRDRIEKRDLTMGVIGLGYVGLPLAVEMAKAGYSTLGFDVAADVVDGVNAGRSHIGDVSGEELAPLVRGGGLRAT